MNFFCHTHAFRSAYPAEVLKSFLRFEDIGKGAYFHRMESEAEDGFILKPKMNWPAKNNFAPIVLASVDDTDDEAKITLHFQPPREIVLFSLLVAVVCVLLFAFSFRSFLHNPWLLLIFPLIFLFFFSIFFIGCHLTYRDCLNKFVKQLKLYPLKENVL